MQNDSLQAVVSNEQIDYAYQSIGQTQTPLNIGSTIGGGPQQTQMSPESVTVTATASFDLYHSQKHSFSERTTDSSSTSPRSSQSSIKIARVVPLTGGQRKRGRQSIDEQLASDNGLPVSAFQISEMSLSEVKQVLKDESLNEYQIQLIRKIRRRGKNKAAARTCRERRRSKPY
ncbi:BZIP domain-containing protein [Caenorhabditis elegans]|nr:BZIP domain-containing protein [Caenorhabditis elegans]CUR30055.1 BZIP domain-containing protein [Caenorhabditis elegans]|eukprot:NP_001303756.1 SKN Related [Caenorhabditis elegans]